MDMLLPCRQQCRSTAPGLAGGSGEVHVSMLSCQLQMANTAVLWPCSHQRGALVVGAMQLAGAGRLVPWSGTW